MTRKPYEPPRKPRFGQPFRELRLWRLDRRGMRVSYWVRVCLK